MGKQHFLLAHAIREELESNLQSYNEDNPFVVHYANFVEETARERHDADDYVFEMSRFLGFFFRRGRFQKWVSGSNLRLSWKGTIY